VVALLADDAGVFSGASGSDRQLATRARKIAGRTTARIGYS
jgi:hypothetical protein